MSGKIIDLNAINHLSALPSREVLLAQVLTAASGVSIGLVTALSDIPKRFINVLQAIKEQKDIAA